MIQGTPFPAVTNTTSVKQQERARRKRADRVRTDVSLMKHQLSTYEGRQFVWRLLERCGVFEDILGTDAAMHEAIGRRRVGLTVMLDAGRFDELFNQMFTEGRTRAAADKREAEAAHQEQQQEAAAATQE